MEHIIIFGGGFLVKFEQILPKRNSETFLLTSAVEQSLISQTYLENELWTVLISSEFERVKPFMVESKEEQNSLNELKIGPRLISSWLTFNKTDKMAWVAQALLIT